MSGFLECIALFLIAFPQATPTQRDLGAPAVYGHVFYKDGSPVMDAEITCPLCPHSGLPNVARTDASGYFMLEHLPFGTSIISASKLSEGFPEFLVGPYYEGKNRAYPSTALVDLKKVVPPVEVTLRLGDPYATIDCTVRSQRTRRPIKLFFDKVTLADDPSTSVPVDRSTLDGHLRLILPRHPVLITLTAPGYAGWTSAQDPELGPTVVLKSGTHLQRDIFLSPTEGVVADKEPHVVP